MTLSYLDNLIKVILYVSGGSVLDFLVRVKVDARWRKPGHEVGIRSE